MSARSSTHTSDTPLAALGGGERLLRPGDILPLIGGCTHAGLRDMVRRGAFPQPLVIGTKLRVWRASVVCRWIAEREADAAQREADAEALRAGRPTDG